MTDRDWAYLIIWQFRVRAGMEKPFEHAYGPQGEWAQLFRQDEAFLGTELIRTPGPGGEYWTLDFWKSQASYEAFRQRHAAEYKAIDQKAEQLTENEREIGKFVRVSG